MALADKKSGFDTSAVVLIALAAILFVCAFALFMQGGFLKAQDIERQAKQSAAVATVDPRRGGTAGPPERRLPLDRPRTRHRRHVHRGRQDAAGEQGGRRA